MDFVIALRGYERTEVDEVLARADTALAPGGETMRAAARAELSAAAFTVCLRGYGTREVDRAVAARLLRLGGTPPQRSEPPFLIALRGYDIEAVDALFAQAYAALAAASPDARTAARQVLLSASFRQRIRGYARAEVDRAVVELAGHLDR